MIFFDDFCNGNQFLFADSVFDNFFFSLHFQKLSENNQILEYLMCIQKKL